MNIKERNSSIELLRILCMLSIIIFHFNARHFNLYVVGNERINENNLLTGLIIHSIGGLGVPIFVFISGWFGLNYRKERAIDLIGTCAFYALLSTALLLVYYDISRPKDALFFLNNWWFIAAYICIYVLTPGINYLFNHTGKYPMLFLILIFLYISYGDTFHKEANIGGLYQMFTMYLSARWLKLYTYNLLTKYCFIILLGAIIIRFGCILISYYTQHLGIIPLINAYTCPITIFLASSIFITFEKIKFQSKIINKLAISALSVYLFSEGTFGKIFFDSWFFNSGSIYFNYIYISIFIYMFITLIDQVRLFLMNKLLYNK